VNDGAAPLKLKARPGARVRLRLGNAATARLATVATSGAKIHIVAVDGQPGEPFEPSTISFRWVLAPGSN
jgi:FtsP/CotA-like multicopper oxidase with cupredoxin domain